MAAIIYLADQNDLNRPSSAVPSVVLDSDGNYWYLYRYFEAANLERHNGELIDLYGGGVIDGYQLHRLIVELEQAKEDIQHKPSSWPMLVGWKSSDISAETEDWRTVEKVEILEIVSLLLALARGATASFKLVCSGD